MIFRTIYCVDALPRAENVILVINQTSHYIDALPWVKNLIMKIQSQALKYYQIQYTTIRDSCLILFIAQKVVFALHIL